MRTDARHLSTILADDDPDQIIEPVGYDFGLSRRTFVQVLGAGIVITATAGSLLAGEGRRGGGGGRRGGGGRGGPPINLGARIHISNEGVITILTGKVEGGQGARAQLTQAAAEELRSPIDDLRLIMADTDLVPDDGPTVGSRTTSSTVPAVRQACAAARELLIALAAEQWKVDRNKIAVHNGAAMFAIPISAGGSLSIKYAALAAADSASQAMQRAVPNDIELIAVKEWKVLGAPSPRPNRRDIVTGAHTYPSDLILPDMLYGKILRAPTYNTTLKSIDLAPAQQLADVVVVRDGNFVGVAAPTTARAKQAIQLLERSAQWDTQPHPSSETIFEHLRREARGGMPANPLAAETASAATTLKAQYNIAYVQHAPMEPRAAVAQWVDGKLTVWTASQRPFGVRGELVNAFHVPENRVQVIVPDFGGGFGGKHTGETAVEAARLAQAAGKPVAVRWTRAEEFTWAYFRPAAAIDIEAALDDQHRISAWHFVNINSGGSALDTPYSVARKNTQYVESAPPLRHGSYRALAATANNFARECFMDELALAAKIDPLQFRLNHLEEGSRLRNVLEDAATRFKWSELVGGAMQPNHGIGIACGTEKGSFVAACALVRVDPDTDEIKVLRIGQSYECGKITTPANLQAQVEGCIIMGLGPALRERMVFENGRLLNASFREYGPPRMDEVPEIDFHLLDRPDLPSVGAGETPLIAIAPAIGNAIFAATGKRLREMPMRI